MAMTKTATKTTQTAKWTGSRRLLRKLRDLMAADADAPERLDGIVRLIARDMAAAVCSIYMRRADDVLELFATEGLKADAVHRTRLHVGEGLVGDVAARARPVVLSDAQNHPNFAYRPETGEEIYKSFLGVPIMRAGGVLGVLVIQGREVRPYADEAVETLEVVGMLLAEVIAAGPLSRHSGTLPADDAAMKPLRLEGVRLAPGCAIGHAVLHRPIVPAGRMVADDVTEEDARLMRVLGVMRDNLDRMVAAADDGNGGEHIDILDSYRMMAQDRGWVRRMRDAIAGGLSAEGAVIRARDETRARMAGIRDGYLRERLQDLDDLAYRLLQHLGQDAPGTPAASDADGDGTSDADSDSDSNADAGDPELPEDMILVARNLGPAELLDYERSRLRALVLEEGSTTAHVAIVARALDIPVIGQVKGVLDCVRPGDLLVVDSSNGVCLVRPGEEHLESFRSSIRLFAEQRETYRREKDLPTVTRDGVEITLMMNAGLLMDMGHLHRLGAAGVGLYRTEISFMARGGDFPDRAAQEAIYRRVLDQADDKGVVFRTLDIGGDKILPALATAREENPAMGWRAMRILLDRPAILRRQLRAMIGASRNRPLKVMFPMIANVDEYRRGRDILDHELQRHLDCGEVGPSALEVGAMLEIPALALQISALSRHADFISIGSNDLLQYLFAADRGNAQLDGRYDPLSAPALDFIARLVRDCAVAGMPVSVCGDMAADPLQALALIGLGVRVLSAPPASIGPIRRMIRSLDLSMAEDFVARQLLSDQPVMRSEFAAFARDHGVAV